MSNLSIRSIWRQAWAAFKRNWLTGIGISIIAYLTIALLYYFLGSHNYFVLILLIGAFGPYVEVIYAGWSMRAIDSGSKVSLGAALSSFYSMFDFVMLNRYFPVSLMWGIFWNSSEYLNFSDADVLYTHLLFYVIVLWSLFFKPYLVLDQGRSISPVKAMRVRRDMPFDFSIPLFLINFLGASIPFGLGLLVTLPFTYLLGAALYRALNPREEPSQAEEDEPAFEWTATSTPAEGEAPPPPSESSK